MTVAAGFLISAVLVFLLWLSGGSLTLFLLFVAFPAGFIGCAIYAFGGGAWSIIAAIAILIINSLLKRAFMNAEEDGLNGPKDSQDWAKFNLKEQLNSAGIVARHIRDMPWDTDFVTEFLGKLPATTRPSESQIQNAIELASKELPIFYKYNQNTGKWRPTHGAVGSRSEYQKQIDFLNKNNNGG